VGILERLQTWYRGTYVPPPRNNPTDPIVFISLGYYEQPLLAKVLRVIGQFWLSHWQWIIGTAITIVGIIVVL
jgi:hypothetical protein